MKIGGASALVTDGLLVGQIAENDYLNGEVIRIDGAQRFGPR
jgi:hypothetical protein